MTRWGAGFSVMAEITKSLINGVVEKYLAPLRSQGHLTFTKQLGRVGKISATLDKLTLEDIEDPTPVGGGVETDLQSEVSLDYRLLWLIHGTPTLVATIENVLVDLPTTPAGLPRGVVLAVTRGFSIRVGFKNARCIAGWLLNTLIAPLLSLGIWLAFTILRRVELPIWPLVDVFNAVGLLFAPGSPLLTAQDQTGDNSLLLASDFSLTGPQGDPRHVASFVPANTNAAAVVHERTVAAAVELAIAKGWVPSRFKVSGWKIYINSIRVAFKQDTIEASGELKAKRGKCWCRVKAKITFRAAVRPRIVDEATVNPKVFFTYDADVKTEISSSGMLVVLGVIMFAPVFMALTLATSFLINIVLRQFLPFTTQAKIDGLKMTVQAASLGFFGFIPLSMKFPLELKGHGTYDLSRFLQFELPDLWGVQPAMSVQYTPESISLDEGELRLGAKLS